MLRGPHVLTATSESRSTNYTPLPVVSNTMNSHSSPHDFGEQWERLPEYVTALATFGAAHYII